MQRETTQHGLTSNASDAGCDADAHALAVLRRFSIDCTDEQRVAVLEALTARIDHIHNVTATLERTGRTVHYDDASSARSSVTVGRRRSSAATSEFRSSGSFRDEDSGTPCSLPEYEHVKCIDTDDAVPWASAHFADTVCTALDEYRGFDGALGDAVGDLLAAFGSRTFTEYFFSVLLDWLGNDALQLQSRLRMVHCLCAVADDLAPTDATAECSNVFVQLIRDALPVLCDVANAARNHDARRDLRRIVGAANAALPLVDGGERSPAGSPDNSPARGARPVAGVRESPQSAVPPIDLAGVSPQPRRRPVARTSIAPFRGGGSAGVAVQTEASIDAGGAMRLRQSEVDRVFPPSSRRSGRRVSTASVATTTNPGSPTTDDRRRAAALLTTAQKCGRLYVTGDLRELLALKTDYEARLAATVGYQRQVTSQSASPEHSPRCASPRPATSQPDAAPSQRPATSGACATTPTNRFTDAVNARIGAINHSRDTAQLDTAVALELAALDTAARFVELVVQHEAARGIVDLTAQLRIVEEHATDRVLAVLHAADKANIVAAPPSMPVVAVCLRSLHALYASNDVVFMAAVGMPATASVTATDARPLPPVNALVRTAAELRAALQHAANVRGPLGHVAWLVAFAAQVLAPFRRTSSPVVVEGLRVIVPAIADVAETLIANFSASLDDAVHGGASAVLLHSLLEVADHVWEHRCITPLLRQAVDGLLGPSTPLTRITRAALHARFTGTGAGGDIHSAFAAATWPYECTALRHAARLAYHCFIVGCDARRDVRWVLSPATGGTAPPARDVQLRQELVDLLSPYTGIALQALSVGVTERKSVPRQVVALAIINAQLATAEAAGRLFAGERAVWAPSYVRFLFLSFLQAYHGGGADPAEGIVAGIAERSVAALRRVLIHGGTAARQSALQLGVVSTLAHEIDLESKVEARRTAELNRTTTAVDLFMKAQEQHDASLEVGPSTPSGGDSLAASFLNKSTDARRDAQPSPAGSPKLPQLPPGAVAAKPLMGVKPGLPVIPKLTLGKCPLPMYFASKGDTTDAMQNAGVGLGTTATTPAAENSSVSPVVPASSPPPAVAIPMPRLVGDAATSSSPSTTPEHRALSKDDSGDSTALPVTGDGDLSESEATRSVSAPAGMMHRTKHAAKTAIMFDKPRGLKHGKGDAQHVVDMDATDVLDHALFPPEMLQEEGIFFAAQRRSRRVYRSLATHVEMVLCVLAGLVGPLGNIDASFADAYTVHSRKANLFFALQSHLQHASNEAVRAPLKAMAAESGSISLQLLAELMVPSPTFKARYAVGQEIGAGAYGKVHACTLVPIDADGSATAAAVETTFSMSHSSSSAGGPRMPSSCPLVMKRVPIERHADDRIAVIGAHTEATVMMTNRELRHVCELIDVGNDGDHYCLVMRRYENAIGAWARAVRLRGLQPQTLVTAILRQYAAVLQAVLALHNRGVVHGDIKADNILVDEHGKVVLCDFGDCDIAHADVSAGPKLFGTEEIRAPELTAPTKYNQDRRRVASPSVKYLRDVWALGCLLYELFTGQHLFAADQPGELIFRVTSEHVDVVPATHRQTLREKLTAAGDSGADAAVDTVLELLTFALKRDPTMRPSLPDLRERVRRALAKGRADATEAMADPHVARPPWRAVAPALSPAGFANVGEMVDWDALRVRAECARFDDSDDQFADVAPHVLLCGDTAMPTPAALGRRAVTHVVSFAALSPVLESAFWHHSLDDVAEMLFPRIADRDWTQYHDDDGRARDDGAATDDVGASEVDVEVAQRFIAAVRFMQSAVASRGNVAITAGRVGPVSMGLVLATTFVAKTYGVPPRAALPLLLRSSRVVQVTDAVEDSRGFALTAALAELCVAASRPSLQSPRNAPPPKSLLQHRVQCLCGLVTVAVPQGTASANVSVEPELSSLTPNDLVPRWPFFSFVAILRGLHATAVVERVVGSDTLQVAYASSHQPCDSPAPGCDVVEHEHVEHYTSVLEHVCAECRFPLAYDFSTSRGTRTHTYVCALPVDGDAAVDYRPASWLSQWRASAAGISTHRALIAASLGV